MLTSRTHDSGCRTALLRNHKNHYMAGRGRRRSFSKNRSQRQEKRIIYIPLSSLLEASNHLLSRYHQTPSEGTPRRSSRSKKCPPYLQSLKCQYSRPTRLKSPQPLQRSSMRRGRHLAGSPSTQLPTITIQITSPREEILGLEALPSSVS
jgi:hypothetical protein